MTSRDAVFDAINTEREYQEWEWGSLAEHPHSVAEWLLILRSELREAEEAWVEGNGDESALGEILQVASVAVACMEEHGVTKRRLPLEFRDFLLSKAVKEMEEKR